MSDTEDARSHKHPSRVQSAAAFPQAISGVPTVPAGGLASTLRAGRIIHFADGKGSLMSALFGHVACCIDDSEASRLALAEARRLAGDDGRLSLVHVTQQPVLYPDPAGAMVPDPASVHEKARRWLERQAASLPSAEAVLLEGHPGSATCVWADEVQPDLIVAAAHRGFAQRVLLGSFANYLAHHSPVNVLLVRPDKILDVPK
jgi:nucleotide-binding universal stress UspA family protein